MDGALLATDHFCQLNSWHLGASDNEAGKGHPLSVREESLTMWLCQRGSLLYTSCLSASRGCSDLWAFTTIYSHAACSSWVDYPALAQQSSEATENLASGLLCSCCGRTRLLMSFTLCKSTPRRDIDAKQHTRVRGYECAAPKLGAFRLWSDSLEL